MPLAPAFALPAPRGSLDNIGSSRGDATPPLPGVGWGDTRFGWAGGDSAPSPYKNRRTTPPRLTLFPLTMAPLPASGSMIVILAMPQMKTRVAATIYKGSGECGARIFHSASQRDRGEHEEGEGEEGRAQNILG